MMDQDEMTRKSLLASLQGQNAHLSFEEAVEDFPKDHINRKVSGIPYSCWDLVEHIRITQRDILEFVRDPYYRSPPWPEGYWPREGGSPEAWNRAISHFLEDRKALEDFVKDRTVNLYSPIPHAPNYTIFREIVLVIDHSAYHVGQLVVLRRALGIWPV